MRKKHLFTITVLLTALFLCSICFAGCSGSAQSNNSDKNNDVVSFAADESKQTISSSPNIAERISKSIVVETTESVEEETDEDYEYDDYDYEDSGDSSYDYEDDVEEQVVYEEQSAEETTYEEPTYEEPAYDEVAEDTSAYEDTYVEEYYEEEYYEEDYSSQMVWISRTGTKYHSDPNCSNMRDPGYVTIEEAEAQGREPCSKCW